MKDPNDSMPLRQKNESLIRLHAADLRNALDRLFCKRGFEALTDEAVEELATMLVVEHRQDQNFLSRMLKK